MFNNTFTCRLTTFQIMNLSYIKQLYKTMKRFIFFLFSIFGALVATAQTPYKQPLPARQHAVTVEFASYLFRHFTLGHEVELGQNISLASKVGIVLQNGSTTNENNYHQRGAFVRTGLKFYRDFPVRSMIWRGLEPDDRMAFEGRYIKPEIILGYFTESAPDAPSTRYNTLSGAIMLNFGRQYAFAKRLLVGYEWGIGYAFSNEDMSKIGQKNYRPYGFYYSHVGLPNTQFPVAFSLGFNVGIVLGKL